MEIEEILKKLPLEIKGCELNIVRNNDGKYDVFYGLYGGEIIETPYFTDKNLKDALRTLLDYITELKEI